MRRRSVGARLHPDCAPDQGAIALSLLALLYKVTRPHPQQHGGEVGRGVPRGFWEGVPEPVLFFWGGSTRKGVPLILSVQGVVRAVVS